MSTVNIFEAKTQLSRLVHEIESGVQKEIIIARNGRPVARLAPLEPKPRGVRIGVAEGLFEAPQDTHALDDVIAEMFYGKDEPSGE